MLMLVLGQARAVGRVLEHTVLTQGNSRSALRCRMLVRSRSCRGAQEPLALAQRVAQCALALGRARSQAKESAQWRKALQLGEEGAAAEELRLWEGVAAATIAGGRRGGGRRLRERKRRSEREREGKRERERESEREREGGEN